MLNKEEVRKHYIFTTEHELDDDNKMLKEYIEQLEIDKQKIIEKLEERIKSVEKCYQELIKPYYDEKIKIIKLKNEKDCINAYLAGDILGLEKIEKDLREQGYTDKDDIIKMLISTYKANYIFLECQTEEYADNFYDYAENLYKKMLNMLFDMLNIDIKKYWERI